MVNAKNVNKNWKNIYYHVQNNEYVDHQYVKIYCNTNQFPLLLFFGPPNKPHSVIGLSKNYHMHLDPKLFHGACEISLISCACNKCTSYLDKPWNTGVPPHQQPHHQITKYCTYWNELGYFNNWNIINFSHKATSSEDLDKIHKVFLDGISDIMSALVKTGQYGTINTPDTTT